MPNTVIESVRSVVKQDIAADIIVVDDFSTEPVVLPDDLASNSRISIIHHVTNRGAASARNTGVGATQTTWVAFLDADDRLLPNTLGARFSYAVDNDDGSPSIFGCGWVYPNGAQARFPNPAKGLPAFAAGCWYAPGSCIIGKRDLFASMPFAEGYDRLEDFDWGIRFGMSGGRLCVVDIAGVELAPGYNARLTSVESAASMLRDKFAALAKDDPQAWRYMCAYLHLEQASTAFGEGEKLKAVRHAIASWWNAPRARLHLSPGWHYRAFKHDQLSTAST